jgi:NADH-quinone oxidoreductase subunit M
MPDFTQILTLAAITIPVLFIPVALSVTRPRTAVIAAAVIALLCVTGAAWPVLTAGSTAPAISFGKPVALPLSTDAFSAVPMLLFAAMVLAVAIASPRRDYGPRGYAGLLLLLGSTLAAYASTSPIGLFIAWTASAAPFVARMWPEDSARVHLRPFLPTVALVSSCVLLAGGLWLPIAMPTAEVFAFALLILAALVRKGVFPFHTWVVSAFADGPLLPFGLLVNAHFGALLIARVAIPMFPELTREALPLVSFLALISAVYTAFVGLGEHNPRRLLALIMLSQAAFIFAGLESRTPEGIAGALTHWLVVSSAMCGLLIVYRLLEARGVTGDGTQYAGLAGRAPRFAVFFAVCGLALVGLPGTLGFCAEDLLFHGALESHRLLGVALPLATALNAINIYRLFSRIFLGRRTETTPVFPDALPRERAVLTVLVLCLIAGGLAPGYVISLRTQTANALATVLSGGVSHVKH